MTDLTKIIPSEVPAVMLARVQADACQCRGCCVRRSWRGADQAKAKLAARKTHALDSDVAALAVLNVVQP